MRVLGIDPGLRTTGFGVVDCDGGRLRYVASGTIRTAAVALPDLPGRLKVIFDGVREIAARYAPTCASVEIVFVNVNPQATLLLGQARGAALSALVANELTVAEYTALQMKRAIVGHGQAKKEQVQQMVMRLLALPGLPGPTRPTRSGWRSATPTPPAASPRSRAARRWRRAPPGATRAVEPTESAHPALAAPGAGRGSSGDNRRPMNALFEDGGKFHAGRVMSETDASLQIELASGKRSKVKAANVLLASPRPSPRRCSARPSRSRARSTSTWRGSSRPKASSPSPSWRATTSAPRPT
jgi:crossover junction endodeoxyribonuclease RuvC